MYLADHVYLDSFVMYFSRAVQGFGKRFPYLSHDYIVPGITNRLIIVECLSNVQ